MDESRPRALFREAEDRAADGVALIVVGVVWLGVDLAEKPMLADVAWFLVLAVGAFAVFAALRLRLLRGLAHAAAAGELAPAPRTARVRPRRDVVRSAIRLPLVVGVAYLLVAMVGGAEFREDALDALGGMAAGVGAAALAETRRLRRIETAAGGTILRGPRSFLRSPRVDEYYVAR